MGKLLERYRDKIKKLETSEREYRQQINALQGKLDADARFYEVVVKQKNKRIDQLEEHLKRLGVTNP